MTKVKTDISQLETVKSLFEGKILDGRNRAKACATLDIEPETIEYIGDDPLGLVLSKNLHRRHLTESQRAVIAAKLANMRQGARTDIQPSANLPKVDSIPEKQGRNGRKLKKKLKPKFHSQKPQKP